MLNLLWLILRPKSKLTSWVEVFRAVNKPKSGLYCLMVWREADGDVLTQLTCLRLANTQFRRINKLLDDSPVIARTGHFERIEFLAEQINLIDGPLRASVVED